MSNISQRASAARENARHSDGKFGSYALDKTEVDLSFLEEQADGEFGQEDRPGPTQRRRRSTPSGCPSTASTPKSNGV